MNCRLKAFLLSFTMIAIVCFSGSVPVQAQPPGGAKELSRSAPVMEIAQPDHNFGEVAEGEVVTHDYVVRNTGSATLEIAQVRAG